MAIALDPSRTWDYILRADRKLPEDQQTTWHMRTLSQRGMMKMVDRMTFTTSDDGESISVGGVGTQSLDVIMDGLVGWTHFVDAGGEEIPSQIVNGRLTMGCVSRIPTSYVLELALNIESGGKLTEDDVEKPEPSPTE